MIPPAMLPERRAGLLLAAVTVLLFGAVAGAIVLPAADPRLDARSDQRRTFDEREARGMAIFRSEGCWYCHTQQVRDVATDRGLGAPLLPGDYSSSGPGMLGAERVGPDLTHVGSRYSGDDLRTLLRAPRAGRRRSSMPAYRHLSSRELDDLTAYLLALA